MLSSFLLILGITSIPCCRDEFIPTKEEAIRSILDYDIDIHPLNPEDTSYAALGMNYSVAGFQLVLSRKASFYVVTYYLPSGLFVVVSWISFLINPEVSCVSQYGLCKWRPFVSYCYAIHCDNVDIVLKTASGLTLHPTGDEMRIVTRETLNNKELVFTCFCNETRQMFRNNPSFLHWMAH